VIIGIVVQAEDIQAIFTAAQLLIDATGQHVPGFELRLMLRIGIRFAVRIVGMMSDLHQRVSQYKTRLRIDLANGMYRRQRGADQLALQLFTALRSMRIKPGHIRPGP